MPEFQCPVCGGVLLRAEGALRCARGHSYDLARQGYVNLLMSARSSEKGHGDDSLMVSARRDFLDRGHYNALCRALCQTAVSLCGDAAQILDVGCGEGFYTCAIKSALAEAGKRCSIMGIDISKKALIAFSGRDKNVALAVASAAALPVSDASCDLVLNVFAPGSDGEFRRVLKAGGHLLCVFGLEDHLMGLKEIVYEKPYPNPAPNYRPEGFRLVKQEEVRRTLVLKERQDIQNLFRMTPYYYKTGRADQEKILSRDRLETPISFGIYVYEKE